MKNYTIQELHQPIGGLFSTPMKLPNSPGEPKYHIGSAGLGDLNQLTLLRGNNFGDKMIVSGAGGDKNLDSALFKTAAETLERYSNIVYSKEQFIWATANELGEEALDLDLVPVCSEKEINDPSCPIKKPDKDKPIRWIKGVSLLSNKPVWIPAVMVFLYIPFQGDGEAFWLPISTGTATHTSYEQAIINGINEVVERDAISLTWLHKLPLPKLEIDISLLPKWVKEYYLEIKKNQHLETIFFDATTDIGIPTIYSVQFSPHNKKIATAVMCTTELDPMVAFTKIMREAASLRIALQNGEAKNNKLENFRDVTDGAHYMGAPERMKEFDFLRKSKNVKKITEIPSLCKNNSKQNLQQLVQLLKSKNIEAFVVDLSTDECLRCGFRTVKVIIPGLQPLSFSYKARYLGHKRLYEAPKNMGYGLRTEDDINPFPQPFA